MPPASEIWLEPGDVRKGLWCDTCATSSRVEVDVNQLTTDGVQPYGVARWCLICDPPRDRR